MWETNELPVPGRSTATVSAIDGSLLGGTSTILLHGPVTLVSLLLIPSTTHTTLPPPSGAQAGERYPLPPIFAHPDHEAPL